MNSVQTQTYLFFYENKENPIQCLPVQVKIAQFNQLLWLLWYGEHLD